MAIGPPTTASNAEQVAWAFERLNDHDIATLRRFWTETTVERLPDRTCVGADEIAAYFESVMAALPDFRIDVLRIVEQDDDVFVRWHISGTHSGAPFWGVAPSGKRVEVDGIDHFVVQDGVVRSNFVVSDQMQFARAVGLLPPDGSLADRLFKGMFNARTRLAARLRRRQRP